MTLPGSRGWLWRPTLRGLIDHREMKDGSVDLLDIARANELLDVFDENNFRMTQK